MSERWSIEQVVALAVTPARFAAGDALAVPTRWISLAADARSVWGRCRGSGREPYDTMVDHIHVAWRCSCPSRQQPCKHALALLAMWARGQVAAGVAPPGVVGWAERHSRPAGSAADRPASDGTGGATEAGPVPTDAPPGDLDRGRDERIERLLGGLIELDRWLDDRVRTGLSDPALARYDTWDELAARLVDARAGALANRVRRLAGVVGARPDWHEVVLAELGVLHLLARAGQRVPALPGPLADRVATACGWQVRQADVLAGVPETDRWVVAGRSDTREDRIEVRRTWLRGATSQSWAMVLSFAAYRQSLDASLPVGMLVHADLHRYPGQSPRALMGRIHEAPGPTLVPPPAVSVADACDEIGRLLAVEPWADRVPFTVRAAPAPVGRRWVLTDDTGSLAIERDAPGLPTLLTAAAGDVVAVTAEWTVDGVVPLTVHLADRAIDIGPVADPSFVAA